MPLLEFLGQMRYRAEAVTAFLACLELIRLGVVRAFQTRAFAEIHASRTERRFHAGPDTRYLQRMTETAAPAPETGAEPRPRETSIERILPALEALLFSSPRPVKEKDLADLLEAAPKAVAAALERLTSRTDTEERGVRVEKVAGGWRFVTRPEFDSLLRKFHEVTERSRLSLAALETLAIIAYRQPITLPEIQEIRGVNSSGVLKTLLEKRLISTAGKKPVVGSPFFYRTTQDFLIRFGLNELAELPRPEDLDSDLAATVDAREIAAPTATETSIHVEASEPPDETEPPGDEPSAEE